MTLSQYSSCVFALNDRCWDRWRCSFNGLSTVSIATASPMLNSAAMRYLKGNG